MQPTIWMRISYVLRANESLAWWRARMEVAFDAVRPLLRQCPGLRAKGYLCPDSGTRLLVRERKCGGYVAFATGKDSGYFEDQYLEWADVQAWRMDEGALVEAVAGALGIEGTAGSANPPYLGSCSESPPYPPVMLELGVCRRGGGRRRVLMCLEPQSEAAIPAVCGIGEGDGVGCVLMPKQFAGVRDLLRMKGATELLMPECLRVEGERIVGDCGGACGAVGGYPDEGGKLPA